MLLVEKTLDYLDYSPSSKILTITRNPFGFKNKFSREDLYLGVSNQKKMDINQSIIFDDDFISDELFERKLINILKNNDIDIVPRGMKIRNKKALPDTLELFEGNYIDETTGQLKNTDSLKRRILGLSSYFRSAQESLLPKYNKILGEDYHIIRIPMSNYQFKIYEEARIAERILEKPKKSSGAKVDKDGVFIEPTSTYRIFSRLFCNFVMPNRPTPSAIKNEKIAKGWEDPVYYKDGKVDEEKNEMIKLLKNAKNEQEEEEDQEEDIDAEGDDVLVKIGDQVYKKAINDAINNIKINAQQFLSIEGLETYSPKFLAILENIQDPEHVGLHLLYSQFRSIEGIGIFTLVLETNGYA